MGKGEEASGKDVGAMVGGEDESGIVCIFRE